MVSDRARAAYEEVWEENGVHPHPVEDMIQWPALAEAATIAINMKWRDPSDPDDAFVTSLFHSGSKGIWLYLAHGGSAGWSFFLWDSVAFITVLEWNRHGD